MTGTIYVLDPAFDRNPALRYRQGSVLQRVGSELVRNERKLLRGRRAHQHIAARQRDAVGERRQLLAQNPRSEACLPLALVTVA